MRDFWREGPVPAPQSVLGFLPGLEIGVFQDTHIIFLLRLRQLLGQHV